jgi:uncharacterized repeat protein (TIGR01451 family)
MVLRLSKRKSYLVFYIYQMKKIIKLWFMLVCAPIVALSATHAQSCTQVRYGQQYPIWDTWIGSVPTAAINMSTSAEGAWVSKPSWTNGANWWWPQYIITSIGTRIADATLYVNQKSSSIKVYWDLTNCAYNGRWWCVGGTQWPHREVASYCATWCGDGSVNPGYESCDDGNENSGDGCSASCQIEPDMCPAVTWFQSIKPTGSCDDRDNTTKDDVYGNDCICRWVPKNYCGDKKQQTPNDYGQNEQCDGTDGVGPNQSCVPAGQANECTIVNKPVDCQVSEWSAWWSCTNGTQTRTRTVTVQPQNGGKACPASSETKDCPVDCSYTWGEWWSCTNGTQIRNPIIGVNPLNDGKSCPKPESRSCNSCGDGIKNNNEQCDGQSWVGPNQSCTNQCTLVNNPYCGDGVRNNNEVCDFNDGSRNNWGNSGCSQQCQQVNNPVCQDANAENNGQVGSCIYKYACNNNYQCVQQKWGAYGSNSCDNKCTPPVPQADVQITKTVDRSTFPNKTGELITWTLNYKNNGPSAAENVVVVDILPEWLRKVVSMSMTAGKIEAWGKYTWYLGTLQPGQSGVITITSEYEWGKADNTRLINVVSIATTTAGDNPNNNNGSSETTPKNRAWLGDFVWFDLNKNGIQDAGEPGVDGLPVKLYRCSDHSLVASTTTDYYGWYFFDNLNPGQYYVWFWWLVWFEPTIKNVGPGAKDSNIGIERKSECVTLWEWEINRTIDAWFVYPNMADVQITKTVDRSTFSNKTGELITWTLNYKNNGPSAAENVVITDTLPRYLELVSSNPTATKTGSIVCVTAPCVATITWNLGSLAAGQTGSIQIISKYLGWASNGSGLVNNVQISTTTTETNYNNNTWSAVTTPSGSGTASLGNYVWVDKDKDGIQDADEVVLSGVKVELYKISSCSADLWTPIMTTTTNGSGLYLFTGLEAGNYKVKFTLANGYEFTMPNQWSDDTVDSDAGLNGVTNCIELKEGENNTTVDAGVYLEQPVSCEWLTLSTTNITVGNTVSYNCLHKNATSAVVTVTLSGSTTWVVNMTWFTGQFTIGQVGTYNVQCTLDNGITYKVVSYAATGSAINCAYRSQANNVNTCAVKSTLDPYLTTGINLSGLIYMPTPYPYCTDVQVADTSYACVAAPAGSQILTRVDNVCRAQLEVTSWGWGGWGWGGWGWGSCRSCGGGGSSYCGNNKVESWEECDGNDKSGFVCTNKCTYSPKWSNPPSPHNPAKPKMSLPSCESIDPPSVNRWEYLPFWWELESDSNVNFVTSCSQSVQGKTNVLKWWSDKSDDPLCHFTMYVDDTANTPAAEFTKYCYQDSNLMQDTLFQDFFASRSESAKWYERSQKDGWSAFFWPSNWDNVPNKYGEYKLSLDRSTFYVCEQTTKADGSKEWKPSTQRYEAKNDGWYTTECSFNFTVTTPYFVQQGKSLGTVNISQNVLNNFFSFDTRWSLIDNIVQISNYQRTSNLSYLGKQFADKYTKLAGAYNANFRKVPGKEIYVKTTTSDLDISAGDLPRWTIISNGGNITIKWDVRGKVMMIANGGSIYFQSTNTDAVQQVEGIYIADWVKSLNQVFNNDLAKPWAEKWWIRVKGIIISTNSADIEQIYSSRRSHLENWFKTWPNYKKDAILNGAALTIETDPSFWTNLPPGANELMSALETYK